MNTPAAIKTGELYRGVLFIFTAVRTTSLLRRMFGKIPGVAECGRVREQLGNAL
jgi:hypothetical protein